MGIYQLRPMPHVSYATLAPTNDPVTYDDVTFYPGSNIIDTFASLRTPKVHAFGLDALEIASSGKVAYSLNDLHSLDMSLGVGSVDLVARNSNALLLANEDRSAVFKLRDDGVASLSVAQGNECVFDVGGDHMLRIDGSNATFCNDVRMTADLVVDGPTMTVPRGATAFRPVAPANGSIYYNSQTRRFEGYAADVWSGLGGVTDVDQNTYISAEDFPGANNNELKFVTNGVEAMRILPNRYVGIGTGNAQYPLDVAGQTRFRSDAVLSTGGNTNQVTPKAFVAGVDALGGSNVTDGDVNDAAGLKVAGLPAGVARTSEHAPRFQKSLLWNHGAEGMRALGTRDAATDEAFWELLGGALHVAHVNPDTGDKLSFVLRVNEADQLELVKRVKRSADIKPSYTTVAYFGPKTGQSVGVTSGIGYAALDAVDSFLAASTSPRTVTARFTVFEAYRTYSVYAALYTSEQAPSSADVVAAAAAGRGYFSGLAPMPAGQDNTVTTVFSVLADGGAVPDAMTKVAIVVKVGDALCAAPFTGYVINRSEYFDNIDVGGYAPVAAVTLGVGITSLLWSNMVGATAVEVAAWVRASVASAFSGAGFDVNQVDVALSAGAGGGVVATVTVLMPTARVAAVVGALTGNPAAVLGGATTAALSSGTVAVAVDPAYAPEPTVAVIPAVPLAPVLTATTSSGVLSVAVSVASGSQTIRRVYTYVSSVEMVAPPLASNVKALAQTSYTPGELAAAGPLSVPFNPTADAFLYVVSENSYGALSTVSSAVSLAPAFSYPRTAGLDASGGTRDLVDQTIDYQLRIKDDITLQSSSDQATTYLLLYDDPADIPATAEATLAYVQGLAEAPASGAAVP